MGTVSLEDFLRPISWALGRTQPPAAPVSEFDTRQGPHHQSEAANQSIDQLTDKFIEEAQKLGIVLVRVENNPIKIGQAAAKAARDFGGERAIIPNVPAVHETQLAQALEAQDFEVTRWNASSPEKSLQAAEKADVGITFVAGAIAETASVMQPASVDNGRAIALYPISHVGVLKRSTIRPHMAQILDLAAELGEMPSNLTFITGPSSTSDIELVRVVGVHGPVHTVVIIVDDA